MTRISIIVPTFNRADILPRCLVAALQQTLPREDYEVIVVDNSTDHTRAIVARMAGVRYVYDATPGLSHARNVGADAARSPIVTYIDDDTIAHPELLERTLEAVGLCGDAGVVGGRIDVRLPDELPKWYSDFFAGWFGRLNPDVDGVTRIEEISRYPFGGNLSIRKDALVAAGGFNPRKGRTRRDFEGGEEIELQCRIAQKGYGIYYTPFARVEHIIFPSRLDWSYIEGTARAAGRNWAHYEEHVLSTGATLESEWTEVRSAAALARATRRHGSSAEYHIRLSQSIFATAKFLEKLRFRGELVERFTNGRSRL
jgi:glycosyltransferase involved in cell wall biosynthesis